jgi:hypothetical protein
VADPDFEDALARKLRSLRLLKSQGLPADETLPCFAPITVACLRSQEEVAYRAACVASIEYRCRLDFLDDLDDFLMEEGLFERFTEAETKMYFDNPEENDERLVEFSWRIEGCHTLFWALGHFAHLRYPDTPIDAQPIYHLFFDKGFVAFVESSKLRSLAKVMDAADLYYRYLSICDRAIQAGEDPPGMLSYSIIRERFVALSWLLGRGDWDELHAKTK